MWCAKYHYFTIIDFCAGEYQLKKIYQNITIHNIQLFCYDFAICAAMQQCARTAGSTCSSGWMTRDSPFSLFIAWKNGWFHKSVRIHQHTLNHALQTQCTSVHNKHFKYTQTTKLSLRAARRKFVFVLHTAIGFWHRNFMFLPLWNCWWDIINWYNQREF